MVVQIHQDSLVEIFFAPANLPRNYHKNRLLAFKVFWLFLEAELLILSSFQRSVVFYF